MSLRIVSPEAKVCFAFTRRGIVMEAALSYFPPRLISFLRAMHLITTSAVYPAIHPLLRELFLDIVPLERVLPHTLANFARCSYEHQHG